MMYQFIEISFPVGVNIVGQPVYMVHRLSVCENKIPTPTFQYRQTLKTEI